MHTRSWSHIFLPSWNCPSSPHGPKHNKIIETSSSPSVPPSQTNGRTQAIGRQHKELREESHQVDMGS